MVSGATINVAAGTYNDESIDITSTNLTIDGAGATTIFDGDLDGRFLTVNASNVTISDMKIKEYGLTSSCNTTGRCGGGAIEIGNTSNTLTGISISGVTFSDNQTDGTSGDGGAIEIQDNCTVSINNCIFNGNKAGTAQSSSINRNGGAIKTNYVGTVTVNNSLFYDNRSRDDGGAFATYGPTVTFNNCTFTDNIHYGSSSGAIYRYAGAVTVNNSIIYNNYYNSSLGDDVRGTSTTNYCIYRSTNSVTNNNTVSTSDPKFNNSASDDFTLQLSSPGIDAGHSDYAPATDINGISRPQGSADDLGCYELTVNSWNGTVSSDWNNSSNWSTASVPGNSDNVVIASAGYDPILNATDEISAIQIASGGVLTISNSSYKLTASSMEIISGGSLVISAGELECNGKFDHDGELTISGGTLDINGEYESSATASETISDGTITVAGEWDGINDNAFTPTGGTVTMDGSSDNNLAQHSSSNFYNLIIANSSGDVDATAALNIDGDLTINSGGDLDIGSSGVNLNLAGSYSNSGTFTISGETITFDGAGTVTCDAISDADAIMYVSKSSGSVTTTGNLTLDEIRVTSGSMVVDGETVSVDDQLIVSGGTLQMTSGAINSTGNFELSGGTVDLDGGTFTSDKDDNNDNVISGGTMDIDGATVNFGQSSDIYSDLDMSGGTFDLGSGTVNISDELDVSNGTITIAGGTLNIGTYTGTTNSTGADRFEMDAGTLNLTAGTINVYGQYASSSYDAIDIESSVTVNANANNTINVAQSAAGSSYDENMYIRFDGNEIGSLTISNNTRSVFTEENIDMKGDLTISSGTFNLDSGDDNLNLEGDISIW